MNAIRLKTCKFNDILIQCRINCITLDYVYDSTLVSSKLWISLHFHQLSCLCFVTSFSILISISFLLCTWFRVSIFVQSLHFMLSTSFCQAFFGWCVVCAISIAHTLAMVHFFATDEIIMNLTMDKVKDGKPVYKLCHVFLDDILKRLQRQILFWYINNLWLLYKSEWLYSVLQYILCVSDVGCDSVYLIYKMFCNRWCNF